MGLVDLAWRVLFDVVLLAGFLGGLAFVAESVGLARDVTAMVLTRTRRTGEVREGRVEVAGRARPDDELLVDPVSGAEAVAYEYRVTEEEAHKDDLIDWTRFGYREEAVGGVAVPFRVEDDDGRVLVDPGEPDARHQLYDGAVTLYATREASTHLDGGEAPPADLARLFERADVEPHGTRARVYETARIEPGDPVYVLGTADFRAGDRVIEGGDDRFVVAGASQLRTFLYNAGWGLLKFVGGVALAVVAGWLLLAELGSVLGVAIA